MKVRIPPFRVALDERISRIQWLRLSGPSEHELEDYLRDWDPATDLHIGVRFEADVDGIVDDVGLSTLSQVRPFLGWKSRSTSLVGGSLGDPISHSSPREVLFCEVMIPGRDAGGIVGLDAALVLSQDGSAPDFVASREGSVLWHRQRTLGLEGDHTRFPVDIVDFATLPGMDRQAGWYLEWDPKDLSAPVMGGIQLRVNAGHPMLGSAVRTGGDASSGRIIREFLRFDTARAMILGALSNPEFSLDHDYDDASVGDALSKLVRAAFPKRGLAELRMRVQTNSSDVDASIQAFLRLLQQPAEVE